MNNTDIENYLGNKYLFYIEDNTLIIAKPISKRIKLPNNQDLITEEWLESKLITNKTFIDLKKYLSKGNFRKVNIYATSYGIGIFMVYNMESYDDIKKIEKLLDANHIQYTTEFSKANWVYRFKLSKSADNIDAIKQMVE